MKVIYKKRSEKNKKIINSKTSITKKRKAATRIKRIYTQKPEKKPPKQKTVIKKKIKKVIKKHKKIRLHKFPISIIPKSYNELLVHNIKSKNDKLKINPYSLFLYSLIVNSNRPNRTGAYNVGISIGKVLYYSTKTAYDTVLSDSLQHIVEFFENVGNRSVTYLILPHQIVFSMSNDDNIQMGINMHIFESGIISGFISSALHNYINVREEKCRHNNSDTCVFVSHTKDTHPIDFPKDRLDKLLKSAISGYNSTESNMSNSYLLLILSLLEKIEFSSNAYKFADRIGREMRKMDNTRKTKNNQIGFIIDGIKLFAVGLPTIKGSNISIKLNKEVSKREVIKLIASFIGGFMNKYPVMIGVKNNNGVYTIRFKR